MFMPTPQYWRPRPEKIKNINRGYVMSYTKALNYYLEVDPYKHKIQPHERARLIASLKILILTMDETLYTPKTGAHTYYFVTHGSLSLERSDGQTTIVSAGDYVGEEAALGLDL